MHTRSLIEVHNIGVVHLQPYPHPEVWITFGSATPFLFLNHLPAGMLYIVSSPPGLGRTSALRILAISEDTLAEEAVAKQAWIWRDNTLTFPYPKASLILEFDFRIPALKDTNSSTMESMLLDLLSTRVVLGVQHFIRRYLTHLGCENLDPGARKLQEEINLDWKVAIPKLMVCIICFHTN